MTYNPFSDLLYGSGARSADAPSLPSSLPRAASLITAAATKTTANSYAQNPPERLDPNNLLTTAANAAGNFGAQAVGAGLQVLDVAGRAPAYFQERPAATVQAGVTRFEKTTGQKVYVPGLSELAGVGMSLLGGAGDVLSTIGNVVPTLANAQTASMLVKYAGASDTTPIDPGFNLLDYLPFGGAANAWINRIAGKAPTTVGQLRANNAALGENGFTAQDIADIQAGRKTVFDYAHKALDSNPVTDGLYRMAMDPVVVGSFAVPALGGASVLGRMVGAGLLRATPLPVTEAARAVAAGIARDATLAGISEYAGQAARTGASLAGRAVALNTKVGIGLGVAEAGIEALAPATGPLAGLRELNHDFFTNRPWSDNTQFMMISALNFQYGRLFGEAARTARAAKYRTIGSSTPARMIEALAEGQQSLRTFAAKQAWVYDRFGGRDAFFQYLDHIHGDIAFDSIAKRFKEVQGNAKSTAEAALRANWMHDLVDTAVRARRAVNGFSAAETVDRARQFYSYRTAGGDALNAVKVPWDGSKAIDQWIEYRTAAAPIGQVLRDTITGLAGSADVPLPVLGLADVVPREALAMERIRLEIAARGAGKEATIANADVRETLRRLPQLMRDDASGFWQRHLTDPGLDAPLVEVQKRLRKLEKQAPTAKDILAPFAQREAKALQDSLDIPLTKPVFPNESSIDAPSVTLRASDFRPSMFGVERSVAKAITGRGEPAVQRVEHNIVDAMGQAGLPVGRVNAVIAGPGKSTALDLALNTSNIAEMRVAAALSGKTTGARYVDLVVTRNRLVRSGLTPNGHEIVWQLPNTDRAALNGVAAVLRGAGFRDISINAETGFVKVITRGQTDAELAAVLDGPVADGLARFYPKDAAGHDGIVRSTNRAYIERIGRSKAGSDVTYRTVATNTSYDPRWAAESAIRDRIAYRTADTGPGPVRPGRGVLDDRPLAQADRSLAETAGTGSPLAAPAEKGYVYHVTSPEALRSISESGLNKYPPGAASASRTEWPEGGIGKRVWYSDSPEHAAAATPGRSVLLRVREADAGTLRADPLSGSLFGQRGVPASLVEVWGGDGAWHPVSSFFERPLGNVPPELAAAAETVRAINKDVPIANVTDNVTAAAVFESDRLAAARAGSPDPLNEAIAMAVRDAALERNVPALKFHGAWADSPQAVQDVIAAWDSLIRAEMPGYQLKPQPNVAWVNTFEGNPVVGALKVREGLAQWLTVSGPLSRLARTFDWLTQAPASSDMVKAAEAAMMTEFVAAGAKPAAVKRFIAGLKEAVAGSETRIFGSDIRLYVDPSHLPAATVNKIGRKVFGEEFAATVGPENFYKLVDRAANRFTRSIIEQGAAGGEVGRLSRALNTLYIAGQDTPGVRALRTLKVFYHMYRFGLDPRWHAMNKGEANILGGLEYGVIGKEGGPTSAAYRTHAIGQSLDETGAGGGWYYPRRREGITSRSFDRLRPETTIDTLNQIGKAELAGLEALFPEVRSIDDLAGIIERQLYDFDTKGVKATMGDTLAADGTILANDLRVMEAAGILQKVYEANDTLYRSIVNVFEGNHSRANWERIMNSYFLYWPLSYQLKAAKWLTDVTTKRIAGVNTGALGAATYSQLWAAHVDGMTNDPQYAAMFNDHQALWFLAQQLLPITPGDLGVSLSRPVRYAVSIGLNQIDPNRMEDGSPLGYWGNYKKALDPVTAALAITEMGPAYTVKQLYQAWKEFGGKPEATPTTFTPRRAPASADAPAIPVP